MPHWTRMTTRDIVDDLDKVFGTRDEYDNHLKRIKELKQFKSDVVDALQFDHDRPDHEYIDAIQEMESEWDPSQLEELQAQVKKLKQQVGVLQRMNKRIKKALEDAETEQADA